jgi:transcriptional antiterminator RfaH
MPEQIGPTRGDAAASGATNPAETWYAIQTRRGQETRVEENLLAWQVEAFLPRMRPAFRRRGAAGTTPPTDALFPCYLFARFDAAAMTHKIRYTRGVAKVLGTPAGPTPVDDGVIGLIRERVDSSGYVVPPPRLRPGDQVRILAGPLKDLLAVFEAPLQASQRVRLLLAAVNGQVRLAIDDALVEKVAGAPGFRA